MYELLKSNQMLISKLVHAGIIDSHWLRDIEMYEEFHGLDINCVMCKYSILAAKYGISEDRVRQRIRELSK